MKILLIIFTIFILSSCKLFTEATTPYTFMSSFKVPDGSPSFKQGYRDGCSFLFYARGNGYYRALHKYKYNPKLNGNPEYRFGYKRGASYCFNYIVSGVKSFDRFLFPDDNSIIAGSINDTEAFGNGLDAPIPQAGGGGIDGIFGMWAGSGKTSAFGSDPLWSGGSKGQFFGQTY